MEKDIEEIREKIENFIRKYSVTVEVETIEVVRSIKGLVSGKAMITIHS